MTDRLTESGGIFVVLFEDGTQVQVVVEAEALCAPGPRPRLWRAVRKDVSSEMVDRPCFSSTGPYAALSMYVSSRCGSGVVEWWRDGWRYAGGSAERIAELELLAEIERQTELTLARRG